MFVGGSRGSHCEENTGRSGGGTTRHGSHAATPADSTPTVLHPQTRQRRPHDGRMDIVSANTAATPTTIEDLITTSKYLNELV